MPAYANADGRLAALAVWAASGRQALGRANLGAPAPVPETTTIQGILFEGLIALLLVFVVMVVATDDRAPAGIAPLGIGFALAASVLLGGPVSGGAGNPARALGPMIVSGTWDTWAIYLIGPVIGRIARAPLYAHVIGKASPPELPVADQVIGTSGPPSSDDE